MGRGVGQHLLPPYNGFYGVSRLPCPAPAPHVGRRNGLLREGLAAVAFGFITQDRCSAPINWGRRCVEATGEEGVKAFLIISSILPPVLGLAS